MRRKDLLKNTILVVVSFVVVLALAEIATRLVFTSNTALNINIGGFKAYHATRGTQLKKDYTAGDIRINSLGILGPEIDVEPRPGVIRILAIGNSVTFSPAPRNYPRVLEERLRDMFPGEEIEVVVGAVPGYSSYEALDWYEELLHELEPDITTIYLGWNDMGQFHPYGLRYKNERLYQDRTLLGRLMEYSYLMRVPYFFGGRIERSRPVDLTPMDADQRRELDAFKPTHFETNLESLIAQLRTAGSDVYLIGLAGLVTGTPTDEELSRMHFPRNMNKKLALYKAVYDKYAASLANVARRTDTPVINLGPLIRTPEQRLIFTDTMHINPEGAELYGAFLAAELRPAVAAIAAERSDSPAKKEGDAR